MLERLGLNLRICKIPEERSAAFVRRISMRMICREATVVRISKVRCENEIEHN